MKSDYINGLIEFIGAIFTWRNVLQLHRDRQVKGVWWPATAFWAVWGLWNLYYYPSLDQWVSFSAGCFLVAGNATWLGFIGYLALQRRAVGRRERDLYLRLYRRRHVLPDEHKYGDCGPHSLEEK